MPGEHSHPFRFTLMATVAELDSRCPPISNWEVHVLQPWAHVDDLKKSDDIAYGFASFVPNYRSYTLRSDYHRDTYADGKLMGTEWNPHLQEKMTQQLQYDPLRMNLPR